MQYFDPILLKEGREWPPNECRVTPEIVEAMPRRVADLYGQMPELVNNDGLGLLKITRRVAELCESHENGNFESEALLAGNFPPLLLSYFASLDNWTELMGLVLVSGFCPCALVGLPLSALLRGTSGRYAEQWDLPGHPPTEWILEQISLDPGPGLLRLDGLTLNKRTMTLEIHRQLLQQFKSNTYTLPSKLIKYKDANIDLQLRQQLHRGINILLPEWIEHKGSNDSKIPNGEKVLRLSPSEFVRFAEKIKFDIPWLSFAKEHFPYLLPEESTGRPTTKTEDRVLGEEDDLPEELQHKLDLLKRAYKEFWAEKDQNQRETHPNNEEVSSWIKEQGISKRQADALASLIRPEWARIGRPPE